MNAISSLATIALRAGPRNAFFGPPKIGKRVRVKKIIEKKMRAYPQCTLNLAL